MTGSSLRRFVVLATTCAVVITLLAVPEAVAANALPLSLGDRGPAVIEAQVRLRAAGFDPGPVDGIFGARTDTAVRALQGARSLPVTGMVDEATWSALGAVADPLLTVGARGSRVLDLQRALYAAGHDPGPRDGVYGSKTAAAVSAFQGASGLPATGAVDQQTWERLFSPAVTPVLTRGSTGAAVEEAQRHLAALGYPPGVIDGRFGLLTEAAVWAFQAAVGLPVTGQVDLATRDRLRSEDTGPGTVLLRLGDRGAAVEALQRRLARVGFAPGAIDGSYGDRTATAVARFQNTFRLPGSGAFNQVTDKRLAAFERDAERGYRAGYVPGAGVEQWRTVITTVFARWGLDQTVCADAANPATCVPPQVEAALDVMYCESRGIPFVVNITSGVTGLFQHRMTYWADRVTRIRARFPDFPADASPYEPEHNAMAAAFLVWQSREALLRNLAAGKTMEDGPHPWIHWTCRRAIDG